MPEKMNVVAGLKNGDDTYIAVTLNRQCGPKKFSLSLSVVALSLPFFLSFILCFFLFPSFLAQQPTAQVFERIFAAVSSAFSVLTSSANMLY